MKKLLEISADHFLKTGINASRHSTVPEMGFFRAPGMDPFAVPGLFSGGVSATDLSAGIVTSVINHFVQGSGTSSLVFAYALNGDIYRFNGTNGTLDSISRTLAASQGQGLIHFQGSLYYSQNAQLGAANNPESYPPAWTDAFAAFTNSLVDHPMHVFQGELFVGDGNLVGSTLGTGEYTGAKLTLPPDVRIIDIDDDGYYLVIACARKGTTGGLLTRIETKVFYWDTDSPNWNFEWSVNEGEVTSISKTNRGRVMRLFTGSGQYLFTYASSPELFTPGSTSSFAPFGVTDLQPSIGGVGFWKGQEAWTSNGRFWTYGQIAPKLPKIFAQPISLSGIKAFFVDGFANIFASATDNKFYRLSTGNTNPVIETNLIDLGAPVDIKAIKLFVGDLLSASTSVQVQITGEDTGTATLDETFNSTNSGIVNRVFTRKTAVLKAEYVRLLITINGGANVRKVELWGDPISMPGNFGGIT